MYSAWGPKCRRGRPAQDIRPKQGLRPRSCWPQCPCFRSFCIRCVDSSPDIPPRPAAPRRVPHRTHRPGKAPRWGRLPKEGIQKFPQVSFRRIIQRRQDGDGRQAAGVCRLPGPFGALGFQHLFGGQIAGLCQSSGAGRSPRPAPAWCPGPRPSSAGRHSPPALWRVSVVHSSLMPRRAALPCRRCRPSRCRRSSSGGHGSARRPSSTSARSARWSGTPE